MSRSDKGRNTEEYVSRSLRTSDKGRHLDGAPIGTIIKQIKLIILIKQASKNSEEKGKIFAQFAIIGGVVFGQIYDFLIILFLFF